MGYSTIDHFSSRYIEINRNIFATLSEAIEEIERSNFLICYLEVINNHSQDLVLLPPNNDPYAYDEEVRMTALVWLEI